MEISKRLQLRPNSISRMIQKYRVNDILGNLNQVDHEKPLNVRRKNGAEADLFLSSAHISAVSTRTIRRKLLDYDFKRLRFVQVYIGWTELFEVKNPSLTSITVVMLFKFDVRKMND